MKTLPTFLSPPALHSQRPRILFPKHPPKCATQPPSIPGGARLEPSPSSLSPLEHQLSNLRFGYEMPQPSEPSHSPCFLRYRCPKGHVIRTRPNSPACRNCPSCVLEMSSRTSNDGNCKLTLCQVSALAYSRGGSLLSTTYVNARTPLTWRCAHGHVWNASVSNVRSGGSWCPECARKRQKLSISQMHEMARERGGRCLSHDYISEHVKLKWKCAKGHVFQLAPNNIRRNPNGKRKSTWCKICAREDRAAAWLSAKHKHQKENAKPAIQAAVKSARLRPRRENVSKGVLTEVSQ